MSNCLFCKIAAGDIPSERVYEDEHAVAFRDINPQAPVHVLVIPKRHVAKLDDADDPVFLGNLMLAAKAVAAQEGIAGAYRVVNNCGETAGQSVFHVHLHVLGGRRLGWPPG